MEWLRLGFRHTVLLAVFYAATVTELSWQAETFTPSWIALAVTLALCVNATSAAIVLAGVGGFLIDATSRGPLGPFLMTYGLLGVLFVSMAPAGRRAWWFTPAVAFTFAAAHPVVMMLLARLDAAPVAEPLPIINTALLRGGVTAFVATLGVLLHAVMLRVVSPATSQEPMQLSNRWKMLTE